ncbi:hypothetical protein B0T37_07005 [Chromobacterium violaceum]|uniref:hypothetical protein n=1 Tax=Chromobacterium violaceum TaxID=536 RepID=UPI0009DB4A95|nr:hypothetical protein [Chromobacterium violaceum]OQS11196.1 hypothetical protein B0T38_04360 [Chromobacterium violaceum]OQS27621.1 hypothetical protein B0T37_07005 [Chromobacterium violaceum]
MRDLSDFGLAEWLRLSPCHDALKQWRNDAWQSMYLAKRAAGQERFVEDLRDPAANLGLVVAFEQPWALNWQLERARVNIPDTRMAVFDNSRRPEMRRQIEQVCRENQVPYLALPANPTRHVNRSHGFAMSWIYRNVVLPAAPRSFAFIDHDMIPVASSRLLVDLDDQPVYGLPNHGDWGWHLWAGYCAFRFDHVRRRRLNFLYDFSNGLDTGGRNWRSLYRELDADRLRMAKHRMREIIDPVNGHPFTIQVIDDCWYHIGSISYNNGFESQFELCQHLAAALAEGRPWAELCPPEA